jgi:tetratricopeptide (TPR) repeat protein
MKKKIFYPVFIAVLTVSLFAACGSKEEKDDPTQEDVKRMQQDTTNQTEDKLEAINAKLRKEPNNGKYYQERAYYYMKEGEYETALKDMNRAIKADPDVAAFHYTKGEIYHTMLDVTIAKTYFDEAIRLDPSFTDAHLMLARIELGSKNSEGTIKHINDALRTDEHSEEAYFIKGLVYEDLGDSALAASSYQTAIEQNPEYFDAYIRLGLLYAGARNALAIEYYSSAISIRPSSIEAHYNLAMFMQENGRLDDAITEYNTILAIDSSWQIAHYNSGYLYLIYSDEYDKAVHHFTKAIRFEPSYVQAYYNRGLAYEQMGNKELAIADYRKTLELDPDFTAAREAINKL